jgi:hypothetical protein
MTLHFVAAYTPALAGLVVGAAVGYLVAARGRFASWDARLTLPLLLAAGTAHLFLILAVERERQLLFGLYFVALALTFAAARAGIRAWKLGAVLFPLGSIAGYFYFAVGVHQVDFIGLAVKVVEVCLVVAAARSAVGFRHVASIG